MPLPIGEMPLSSYVKLPALKPAYYIEEATLEDIAKIMKREAAPDRYVTPDVSLVGQLAKLVTLDEEGLRPAVDAVAVTYTSAIPVADAVRGVFDACGLTRPLIIGIHCNKDWEIIRARDETLGNAEALRLQTLLNGAKSVTVVDQFKITGETIDRAAEFLKSAGAQTVRALRGIWYEHTVLSELNIETLSSRYADQMYTIGKQCALKYLELNDVTA